MFFHTVKTLIDNHCVKSVNVKIANDSKGLYALVNLAIDTDRVEDDAVLSACSTPFLIRDDGVGIDERAGFLIEQMYQDFVDIDALNSSKSMSSLVSKMKGEDCNGDSNSDSDGDDYQRRSSEDIFSGSIKI